MKVSVYDDVSEFWDRSRPLLLKHEAENCLAIGIVSDLLAGNPASEASNPQPRFWCVESDGAIVAAAIWTPPFPAIVVSCDDEATEQLAARMKEDGANPPGVNALTSTASTFRDAWIRRTKQTAKLKTAMRVYQLDQVHPVRSVPGGLEVAGQNDLSLILAWHRAFMHDVGLDHILTEFSARQRVGRAEIALWRDGEPKCMAGFSGRTPNGIRVNVVYTPPENRRQGWASAAVAALSQRLLDSGLKHCFLFTDLMNPTSNHIYQEMGYRPVADVQEFAFE